jgi:hypothetical protein
MALRFARVPARGSAGEVFGDARPWCVVTTSSPTHPGNLPIDVHQRQWDLVVGTMASDDLVQHLKLAHFTHETKLTTLYGSLCGMEAHVGPIVVPTRTVCWNCRLRMLANVGPSWATHALQLTQSAQHVRAHLRMNLVAGTGPELQSAQPHT